METVEFSNIQAALHCPIASAAGYEPEPIFSNPELGREVLEEWPDSKPLKRVARSRQDAARWMSRTRFAMSPDRAWPPSPENDTDYWTGGRIGHARVELPGGQEKIAICRLPYLRRVSGTWEVTYCYTGKTPMSLRRRSDLILRTQWDQSVFRSITNQTLFARLLAPGYQHEESLSVPSTSLMSILSQHVALTAAPTATPGRHCSDTKSENNTSKWRCPIRQQDNCSAIRALHESDRATNMHRSQTA